MRLFARNPVRYSFQHHADQCPEELQAFWGELLGVEPSCVRPQPKSNSGRLTLRVWRCEHGVLTVRASDTLFRARLQAWMARVQEDWGLDSAA